MPKKKTPTKLKEEPTAKQEKIAKVVSMPKKKTASKVKGEPTDVPEKPAKSPKQTSDEIDEIFASKKRKNPEVELSKKPKEIVNGITRNEKEKEKKKKKTKRSQGELHSLSEGSRRKTNDGLRIYSSGELGINKQGSGFTPLCPFDCSCCF